MKRVQLTTVTEIEDFVRGATYFGTGGGGSYEGGVEVLTRLLEEGKEISWISAHEIADDLETACPFGMGSIAPKTEKEERKREYFGATEIKYQRGYDFKRALEELEKETGKKIDVLVPIELGGGNTSTCIAAAILSGRQVVDGDYTGRAIPEIYQTTPYIYGKEYLPLTSVDKWGNISLIREAVNFRMAERIGKFISAAAFTGCAMSGFQMPARDMKEILIHGTLTECYELGKSIREIRENGGDPVEAGRAFLDGWILTTGEVTIRDWWDEEGYLWGWHTIVDDKDKNKWKIFFKNENHLCYCNDKIVATSPDIIVVVDAKTGEPLTNTNIKEGMEVAIIGSVARKEFRSPRGLEALGPQNFGENAPYKPIEDNMK